MLNEVRITSEQFNHINRIRFDFPQKFLYINNLFGSKYFLTEETVFVTYQDTRNYYLVFEAEEKPSTKIRPSSILDKLKE